MGSGSNYGDGTTLVFVEVKYRSCERYGSPLEVVTKRKQQKIACSVYLERLACVSCVRFDVVVLFQKEQFSNPLGEGSF